MRLLDECAISAPVGCRYKVSKYVFKTKRIEIEPDKKYDIALVLGCSIKEVMMKRIEDAFKLYESGIIKKIYLTGGIGFLSKNREESEANVMKRYLLSKGVPEEDIVVEDKSRDTYENMKNSLDLIKGEVGEDGTIILVTSDFHQKRAKGMLEKMTPCSIYSYGVEDGKHDFSNWFKSPTAVKMIRIEAFLLYWYAKKGIIDNLSVDNIDNNVRK